MIKPIKYKYKKLNGEKGINYIHVNFDKESNILKAEKTITDFLILEHELLFVEILEGIICLS